MIDLLSLSDDVTVHGRSIHLFDNLDFHLEPGRYALLSTTPELRRSVLDVLAGLRPPRRGHVRCTGSVSWPIGRNGIASGKATGQDAIELISAIHGLEYPRACELVSLLVPRPDYLDEPFNTWPQYVKQEFNFALGLLPQFDLYVIDGAIPFEESRFTRMWQSLFEDRLVGKSLILSTPRQKQMLDYCTKALIYDGMDFTVDDDLESCIERYPAHSVREEMGTSASAGSSDDAEFFF
ncbi:ATPase [Novosphingobium sp. PhB57]|uniref:ATPase n=1 Tax=Novosphingobium sp. PhB57 TaxID=2485107 RepID=UPI001405294B|nr:ATPase [Novosphingobium sp. PhB57]